MSALANHHTVLGARLAPDGIPLDYGDVEAELAAARQRAILLDRSHEGRILLRGRDRLDLVNRMSTNNVAQLTIGQGAPTIFTNANARILFRAIMLPEGRRSAGGERGGARRCVDGLPEAQHILRRSSRGGRH